MTTGRAPIGHRPIVSVIIPVKNGERYIAEAIATSLDQGSDVGEVIVVDDCSSDNTRGVVCVIPDPRLKLLSVEGNGGVSAARNSGARAASGRWLLFLDADDRLRPNAVRNLLAASAECPGTVVVYGDFGRIDQQSRWTGVRNLVRRRKPSGWVLEAMIRHFFLGNGGTSLVRADTFQDAGGFDVGLRFCEDWHLWCRLAALGPFAFCEHARVLDYRLHAGNTMKGSCRSYSDFLPAINAVFSDPLLIRHLKRPKLRELRSSAEAHMLSYSATLAARNGDYRRAAGYAWMSIMRRPSRTPTILARVALTGIWK